MEKYFLFQMYFPVEIPSEVMCFLVFYWLTASDINGWTSKLTQNILA